MVSFYSFAFLALAILTNGGMHSWLLKKKVKEFPEDNFYSSYNMRVKIH